MFYAQKYRTLEVLLLEDRNYSYDNSYRSQSSSRVMKRENKSNNPSGDGKLILSEAIRYLARRAETIIEPLWKSVVKEPEILVKKEKLRQGFYCIDLDDDEVPWKGLSW